VSRAKRATSDAFVDSGMPLEVTVAADEAELRLEQLVRRRVPGISRGSVQRLLERGQVLVDGRAEPKGLRVRPGQQIVIAAGARSEAPLPQLELPLEVIALEPDLVVINKAAGPPCHPLVPGETDTVANALVARFPECAGASPAAREAGLVHRLDASTSGVLLAARSAEAYGRLRGMFSAGRVRKQYLALVAGAILEPGEIALALRTMPGDGRRMAVLSADKDGLAARTSYEPLQRLGSFTLVRLTACSGRRHQLRVHMAHLGHPLAGDVLYGGPPLEGLDGALLHARRLELGPEGSVFEAPLPEWRRGLLVGLGAEVDRI
jgi:23S rRNA pseudouridine1911/1915/1917 synthase